MMTVSNLENCVPFTTKDGSTIRELLNAGNSSLQNQSLAHATLKIGMATVRHYHPRSEEIYFILSGRGHMEIDGIEHKIGVGDAIAIPRGMRHQIENTGSEPLHFLCMCAPAYTHDDTIFDE